MNATTSRRSSWIKFKRLPIVRAGMLLLCLAAATGKAQTFSVLHYFGGVEGQFPSANLVTDGTSLYGMTLKSVFKLSLDGSQFTPLCDMYWNDLAPSEGGLALSGSTLYVATGHDLVSPSYGSVFKINTDGTGFTVLKQFTGDNDGGRPCGAPLLSGTTLYGTTYSGGNSNCGVVFKINTDGTGFVVLRQFTGDTDGGCPYADLLLSDTTLYGTTGCGGTGPYGGYGTVFKVNTDGSDFTVLHQFAGGEAGTFPMGGLTLSGTTLYGTTLSGGIAPPDYGNGTVFKINTDGSGFTVLHRFTGDSGGNSPMGNLALRGTMLFGCTDLGGAADYGTVFRVNTDGSGFSVLHDFDYTCGALPRGGVMLCGSDLYGTAWMGATGGVVFAMSLPIPTLLTAPQSQTAEAGSVVRLQVDAGPPPLSYQWFLNGSNTVGLVTTDSWLELTNVQTCDCGAYTVVITNAYDIITSPPAMLNVTAAVERRPVPGVLVLGEAGRVLNVDYADSLSGATKWLPLDTGVLPNTSQYYFDLTTSLPPQRLYRAWQTGTPGVLPSLDLHIVPAITVTGNISDSVRVDCINRFGPIDAWVTLDTVTLTNTSQLYFDTGAWRQPQRLYRLVPVP